MEEEIEGGMRWGHDEVNAARSKGGSHSWEIAFFFTSVPPQKMDALGAHCVGGHGCGL